MNRNFLSPQPLALPANSSYSMSNLNQSANIHPNNNNNNMSPQRSRRRWNQNNGRGEDTTQHSGNGIFNLCKIILFIILEETFSNFGSHSKINNFQSPSILQPQHQQQQFLQMNNKPVQPDTPLGYRNGNMAYNYGMAGPQMSTSISLNSSLNQRFSEEFNPTSTSSPLQTPNLMHRPQSNYNSRLQSTQYGGGGMMPGYGIEKASQQIQKSTGVKLVGKNSGYGIMNTYRSGMSEGQQPIVGGIFERKGTSRNSFSKRYLSNFNNAVCQ